MRRKDREIVDFSKVIEILDASEVCRLGFVDGEEVYIVPMNYGYELDGEKIVFYFHGAGDGRKIDLIRKNSKASFEIDLKHELVKGEKACDFSYKYQSLMGVGNIGIVKDEEGKIHGLDVLMNKFAQGKKLEYNEALLNRMAVIKLEVETWSCKEH